jgi:dynein heavy chain
MKENTLKKTMKQMKADWGDGGDTPICLDTAPYKDTGASLLRGIDDVQTVLDDHIVKTQGIRSSPFCKPFEAEVHTWEATLLYIQDFVDQTLLVQRTWQSLEPIFVSDDIKRQLPGESAAFADVDLMFRKRMKEVSADTRCLQIAKIPNIVEDMTAANESLEKVQKGLKDYLETKRLYFPRFFFLNDTDLLSILAETKDPTLVQPHMGKLSKVSSP